MFLILTSTGRGKNKKRRNLEGVEMCKKYFFPNIDILKGNSGYSFMELMMVLSIIAIVAQIGFTAWMDYKRRAYDASAVADTRNLIEAIVNDMVGFEDVLYDHAPDDGPRVGAISNTGTPRKPSLFLSPGVKADITGSTAWLDTVSNDEFTFVSAFIWHGGGTPWPGVGNDDDVREFMATVDEVNEIIEFHGLEAASPP